MFGFLSYFEVMLALWWVHSSQGTPFLIDDSVKYCTFRFKGEEKLIQATSETFHLNSFGMKTVHYKLCGQFGSGEVCPAQTAACVKDHKNGQIVSLGTKFSFEENKYLHSKKGSRCRNSQAYQLQIYLSNDLTPKIVSNENCTLKVNMHLPAYSTTCGLEISGKYLDLKPLSKSLRVVTTERNFSLTLCDYEPSCGFEEDVSACEIIGKTITPISSTSSLVPSFDGNLNRIVFKGYTLVTLTLTKIKTDKRLEIRLMCNWSKKEVESGDLTYIKVPTQGKRYTFELQTSYGCVKKNKPCIVQNENFVYNLSKLYFNHKQTWQVDDGKDNTYFIQLCEPLSLKETRNFCNGTYAEVCQLSRGSYVNRGSILSHLEVDNNVLTATIDTGAKCTKEYQYKTIINFVCDSEEHGPKLQHFEYQSACDTFFEWRTPEACPIYNTSLCGNFEETSYPCVFNQSGKLYDFNSLRGLRVVKDRRNPELSFLLNVCGVVLDEDAPCVKDVSVFMKNSSEPNVKFRITSLGKFPEDTNINGNMVLAYKSGGYCDGSDYKSQIHIQCSNKEEPITVKQEEKCLYDFYWKTPLGCPKTSENYSIRDNVNCLFTDTKTGDTLELDHITPMKIEEATHTTTFFFCSKVYSICRHEDTDCPKVQLNIESVNISNHLTTARYTLNHRCNIETNFNVVILKIRCERIKHNQHFDWRLDGCVLTLSYFTDKICPSQRIPDQPDSVERSTESYDVNTLAVNTGDRVLQSEGQSSLNTIEKNCSLKSPYTLTEVNLHNFSNNFFNTRCPTNTKFNKTFEYVLLLYTTNNLCLPEPTRNMSYEVFLMCSTGKELFLNSQTDNCLTPITYKNHEYCDLFIEPEALLETPNTLLIIGSVSGSVLLFFGLLSLTVIYRKGKCRGALQRRELMGLYERDTDS